MKKYFAPFSLRKHGSRNVLDSRVGFAATPVPLPFRPSGAQPQQRPAAALIWLRWVEFQADQRLIIMMASRLPASIRAHGRQPSAFRSQVRKDLEGLDPDLRGRLRPL